MLPTRWGNHKEFLFFLGGGTPIGILILLLLITLIDLQKKTIDKSNRNWPHAVFQSVITFSSFMSDHIVWRDHEKTSLNFEKATCLVFYFNSGKKLSKSSSSSPSGDVVHTHSPHAIPNPT